MTLLQFLIEINSGIDAPVYAYFVTGIADIYLWQFFTGEKKPD